MQVLENGSICTSFGHVEEPYIKSNTHHFAGKLHLEGVGIYIYVCVYFSNATWFFFCPPNFKPASIIYYVNNVGATLVLLRFVWNGPHNTKKDECTYALNYDK